MSNNIRHIFVEIDIQFHLKRNQVKLLRICSQEKCSEEDNCKTTKHKFLRFYGLKCRLNLSIKRP